MRKLLLAGALMAVVFQAQADYKCSVTPRDDIVLKPQSVQVVGQNGDLTITPNGDVTFNGKTHTLSAAQREQAQDYQQALRTALPWIDNGARSRLEKSKTALDRIITEQVGADSGMHKRLTKLDAQIKEQLNRIIEHRSDGGLTFHHQGIDKVRADGQQLVNQAMGGILQDSINEMGARALTKGGNNLQSVLGNLGGLQNAIQNEWKTQEKDFDKFGKDVCSRVVSLEDQRKALVSGLK